MDHAEAREALDLAAVEPGGVERLEAGDAPEAAALAGHLIECRSCAAEWERLRRTSFVLRAALRPGSPKTGVATLARPGDDAPESAVGSRARVADSASGLGSDSDVPPPELRDRTLRFVREVGRQRGSVVSEPGRGTTPPPSQPAAPPEPASGVLVPASRLTALRRRRRLLGELAGIAAALVLIVGLSALAIVRDGQLRDAQRATSAVSEIADAQARLATAPDVRVVRLTVAAGSGVGSTAIGTLLMSPSTTESVMFATGLPAPPAGKVYRCWVETPGGRQILGELRVEGAVAYWWDWVKVPGLAPGARFGVSLAPTTGNSGGSAPLLTGTLGS